MFDNIHFQVVNINTPINNRNFEYKFPYYFGDSFYNKSLNNLSFFMKSSFLIEGIAKVCFPHHITIFAKESLFYIQNFCLLNVGKNYFTKREKLDSFLILYTYDGHGYLEYGGKSFCLSKGDGFIIDCQQPHFYRTDGDNWVHADLHFSGAFSQKIFDEISANGNVTFSQSNISFFASQLENLIKLYEDISQFREFQISNQLENLLMTLLLNSSFSEETANSAPENIKYLVKYIENNYTKPLTLDFLSKFSNISKYHLIRLFNKYLGYPPHEYIIQLQIQNAKVLLETTSLPANKIGTTVGIQNENYFNRLFKSRVGIPPGNYRNEYLKTK
ncbi:AraC-like DNA-binding protein [Anaerobacterium chartisolvens]|uniref:AraC-like DNA-binding protein n=1 Tax=Anaerobacterium chartisolvens TaxID=1297424 RepID=A0A369B0C5_9FIRM|nr:AraC family transcriptional regulator [Anaerobacterium chartisolvens]RCX13887.1 AraC-like DNA-binding protein [Anaerobacterium chartisolvens]